MANRHPAETANPARKPEPNPEVRDVPPASLCPDQRFRRPRPGRDRPGQRRPLRLRRGYPEGAGPGALRAERERLRLEPRHRPDHRAHRPRARHLRRHPGRALARLRPARLRRLLLGHRPARVRARGRLLPARRRQARRPRPGARRAVLVAGRGGAARARAAHLRALRLHARLGVLALRAQLDEGPVQKRRVVGDDEEALRALVRAALEPTDCDIVEACDGDESYELARSVRPDLIVLDMMMPGRSGLEVLAELRAQPEFEDTPVVMLTARTQATDRSAA